MNDEEDEEGAEKVEVDEKEDEDEEKEEDKEKEEKEVQEVIIAVADSRWVSLLSPLYLRTHCPLMMNRRRRRASADCPLAVAPGERSLPPALSDGPSPPTPSPAPPPPPAVSPGTIKRK